MKQEAVSMVTSDRDRCVKSNSESCDIVLSPRYLFFFPGFHWREGSRWAGWRYWPARTPWRHWSCWADGRERRASKIWNIANFVSYATMSTNTYGTITSHHWVISNVCSHFGMWYYEPESRRKVKKTVRGYISVIMSAFLKVGFFSWCDTLINVLCCLMRITVIIYNIDICCFAICLLGRERTSRASWAWWRTGTKRAARGCRTSWASRGGWRQGVVNS